MQGNLTLSYDEVRNEVENINRLAKQVQADADALLAKTKACVNDGIVTEWGEQFKASINNLNNTKIADAINQIALQGQKLEEIAQQTATYSQGQ